MRMRRWKDEEDVSYKMFEALMDGPRRAVGGSGGSDGSAHSRKLERAKAKAVFTLDDRNEVARFAQRELVSGYANTRCVAASMHQAATYVPHENESRDAEVSDAGVLDLNPFSITSANFCSQFLHQCDDACACHLRQEGEPSIRSKALLRNRGKSAWTGMDALGKDQQQRRPSGSAGDSGAAAQTVLRRPQRGTEAAQQPAAQQPVPKFNRQRPPLPRLSSRPAPQQPVRSCRANSAEGRATGRIGCSVCVLANVGQFLVGRAMAMQWCSRPLPEDGQKAVATVVRGTLDLALGASTGI